MDIKDSILGNASDREWKERLEGAQIDWLELSQWDAQKNRFRRDTQAGRPLAVALERGRTLRDGDILEWDEARRRAVVCRIRLCPVMAVDMHGLSARPAEEALSAAVRLGHALGNQHWPAVVKENMVYVPVSTGTDVAASVMDTHAILGTSYVFLAGEDVLSLLDEHEARRLFGGAERPDGSHSHHHGGPHEHKHEPDAFHDHKGRGREAVGVQGDADAQHRDQHHHHGLFYEGLDGAHGSEPDRVFRHGFGREHRHGIRRTESRGHGHGVREGRSPFGAMGLSLPERHLNEGGEGPSPRTRGRGPHGRRHRGRRHGHYDEV